MPLFAPRERTKKQDENGSASREFRGLRASAVRLKLDNSRALANQASRRQEWQDEAWDYFSDIGEIHYTARLAGNVMSKLRFFVAVRPLDEPEGDPISVFDEGSGIPAALAQRATAELERLKSPFGGRAEIIRMLHINLEVVAEAYLVGIAPRAETTIDPKTGDEVEQIIAESWEIKSVDEVEVDAQSKKVTIHRTPGDNGMVLNREMGDVAIRIWERSPRFSFLPDCAMRGVLGICESLVLLENQVKAIAKSHASAGFFTLPNELELLKDPRRAPEGEGDEDEEQQSFRDAFDETLTEPIQDPASAAGVAPMPITGPAEYLKPEYLRHIPLFRPTDATLDQRIEGRVLRMARGLNYPVETVLGHQQTTFANAAQIDEDKFKDHFEPRAVLMCDSFTVGFLQPNLIEAGENADLVERMLVWFDPSGILKGVDPTETAREGWDIGAISDAAWRRVKGWTEDDAPDPVELLVRSVLKLRSLDPGVSTAVLELLGVPLDIPAQLPAAQAAGTSVAAGQMAAPQSLPEALLMLLAAHKAGVAPSSAVHARVAAVATPEAVRAAKRASTNVGRQLMDLDRDLRARLLVAAHQHLVSALTKAGNRIKTKITSQLARKSADAVVVRNLHPRYVAATLGKERVAAAGLGDTDLIAGDAWEGLEQQFMAWGQAAQVTAVNLASSIVGISKGERTAIRVKQAHDLAEAWQWMREAMGGLASRRLYDPDPQDPTFGEFDPNSTVPAGLVRQALARAGGATGLSRLSAAAVTPLEGVWVVLNNGQPPGGIGTGELIGTTLANGGAGTEGYEWVYGPAYRKNPFEEHEALDGTVVESFDGGDWSAEGSWIEFGSYFPGDHEGCCCDVSPVIVGPDEVAINEATGDLSGGFVSPNDIEGMIGAATSAEGVVSADLAEVAGGRGGDLAGFEFRLKGEGSLARKIGSDAAEKGWTQRRAATVIADNLRYTTTFAPEDYTAGVRAAAKDMRAKGYTFAKVKNTWEPPSSAYRGINTQVISPDGYKFELQFHTPESFRLKNEANHRDYEAFRTLSGPDKAGKPGQALLKAMADRSERLAEPSGASMLRSL